MSRLAGTVAELWRYPVKSLGGEQIDQVLCTQRGFEYDRWWAVRGLDGKVGSGKTTRRFRRMPGLLSLSALVDESGRGRLNPADGRTIGLEDPAASQLVSEVVGEPIEIVGEEATSHFDDSPLHLVTLTTLERLSSRLPASQVDRRRFRPNLVIDDRGDQTGESQWIGKTLQIGKATIVVEKPTERCVMTTLPQAGLRRAPSILRDLHHDADLCFGLYARVLTEGQIRCGDELVILEPDGTSDLEAPLPPAPYAWRGADDL